MAQSLKNVSKSLILALNILKFIILQVKRLSLFFLSLLDFPWDSMILLMELVFGLKSLTKQLIKNRIWRNISKVKLFQINPERNKCISKLNSAGKGYKWA